MVRPVVADAKRRSMFFPLTIGCKLSRKIICPFPSNSGVMTYRLSCWFNDIIPFLFSSSAKQAPMISQPSIHTIVSIGLLYWYSFAISLATS